MATDASGSPKASAAGAQPEPMTTATSCSDCSAVVRSSAARAASSSGSGAVTGSTPQDANAGQRARIGTAGGETAHALGHRTRAPPYRREMRIAVLGPLEVHGDDTAPIAVPGAKERQLLAVLVAGAPAVVGTDRIVDQLW